MAAGGAEILQEYLVKLGFATDAIGVKKMDGALGMIGKKAFSVGSAVMGMAVTAEAAIGIFSSQMEKMYYASKLSNSSVTNLKSLAFAGKSVGIMGDQIGDAVHNMAQALRLNPGMQQLIESFGVKVKGRDISDVAMDTMQALSRQPEWLGAQWANQLFGMDADTYHLLVATPGALDKLAEAQKRNIDLYKEYGMNADEAAKQSVEYMNSLRNLENRMGVFKDVILKDLQPAFNTLNNILLTSIDYWTKYAQTHDLLGGISFGKEDDEQATNIIWGIMHPVDTVKDLLKEDPEKAKKDPDYRRHIDYGKKTKDWMDSQWYPLLHSDAVNAEHAKRMELKPSMGAAPARVSASNSLADIEKAHNYPAGLLSSWMRVESHGNVNAISNKGARGRFQVMPATSAKPGFGLSAWNPLDTVDNHDAESAARYLDALIKKHGTLELALAAYNGGTGNVDKFHGIPPFKETQDYVKNVMGGINNTKLGAIGGTGTNVAIHQENTFNISGSGGRSSSEAIIAGQSRTNADLVRGFKGSVH